MDRTALLFEGYTFRVQKGEVSFDDRVKSLANLNKMQSSDKFKAVDKLVSQSDKLAEIIVLSQFIESLLDYKSSFDSLYGAIEHSVQRETIKMMRQSKMARKIEKLSVNEI